MAQGAKNEVACQAENLTRDRKERNLCCGKSGMYISEWSVTKRSGAFCGHHVKAACHFLVGGQQGLQNISI